MKLWLIQMWDQKGPWRRKTGKAPAKHRNTGHGVGNLLKLFKGETVKIGISSEELPPCLQSPPASESRMPLALVLVFVSTLVTFQTAPAEVAHRADMHVLLWEQPVFR